MSQEYLKSLTKSKLWLDKHFKYQLKQHPDIMYIPCTENSYFHDDNILRIVRRPLTLEQGPD